MSTNYWTDWAQNKRIEDAEARLASERSARNRLAQQMQERHGNLEAQIGRLTTAFIALLEHEDIRGELAQHADAAAVRRHAREVVAATIVTGAGTVRDLAPPRDVPGYWLAAAAQALAGVRPDGSGDTGVRELLTEASRRDRDRTAAFVTLLDCQARRSRWSAETLALVLPAAATTHLQRQIWRAIAAGRLGETALQALREHLAAHLATLDPVAVDSAVLRALGADEAGGATPATGPRAADLLVRLRACVDGHGAPATPARTRAGEGTARRVLLAYGADVDDAPQAPPAPEDPLSDCLRALVDQGSPAEGDILRRMSEVRRQLGYDAPDTTLDIDAEVGSALDLLIADLVAPAGTTTPTDPAGATEPTAAGAPEPTDPTAAGAHALARTVLRDALLRIADRLHADAGAPVPDTAEVQVGAAAVTVTDQGTAADWRTPATTAARARTPRTTWLRPAAIAGLVIGLIGAGLGFVSGGFWLLAILGLAGAGAALAADRRERGELRRRTDAAVRTAEHDIATAAARITTDRQDRAEAMVVADAQAAALRSVLT